MKKPAGDGCWEFSDGMHNVVVEPGYKIRVKSNDWLSKYSAAIYGKGDFSHIGEFFRTDSAGRLVAILNPNRISAGETLVWKPPAGSPYADLFGGQPKPDRQTIPVNMTPAQKREFIQSVSGEYKLLGNHLPFVEWASRSLDGIDLVGGTILGEICGLIGEGGLLAAGATAVSFGSIFIGWFANVVSLINQGETSERMSGMRAVAYTVTAWAFDDFNGGLVPPSSKMLANMRSGGGEGSRRIGGSMIRMEEQKAIMAWNRSAAATRSALETKVAQSGTSKKSFQLALRFKANDDRQQMCRAILESFRPDLDRYARMAWEASWIIRYPE